MPDPMNWRRVVATLLEVPIHLVDFAVCRVSQGALCPYQLGNGRPTRLRRGLWWIQDHSAFWTPTEKHDA